MSGDPWAVIIGIQVTFGTLWTYILAALVKKHVVLKECNLLE